jgi:hypothetical protein
MFRMKPQKIVIVLIFAFLLVSIQPSRADLVGHGLYLASGPYIRSPSNETYNSGFLILCVDFHARIYGNVNYSIAYSLDGQKNETFELEKHNFGWQHEEKSYLDASVELPALSNGSHCLTVYVQSVIVIYDGSWHTYADIDSQTVYFTVLSSIWLLMENETYDSTEIPLNFYVNETTSQIAYSLDNQANVTITGNTTLTGLTEGQHTLFVYANDELENKTDFDITTFNINKQISSSENPLQSLSPEFLWLAFLSLAIAILSAVFFVRKKKAIKGILKKKTILMLSL